MSGSDESDQARRIRLHRTLHDRLDRRPPLGPACCPPRLFLQPQAWGWAPLPESRVRPAVGSHRIDLGSRFAVALIEAFGQAGGKRSAVGLAERFGNAGNQGLTVTLAAFWPAHFRIGRLSQIKMGGCTCLGAIIKWLKLSAAKPMRAVAIPPFPPIAACCRSATASVAPRRTIPHWAPMSMLGACSS